MTVPINQATRKAYAQGDVLLLPTEEAPLPWDDIWTDLPVVLAEGEHTGHRHAFYDGAQMLRDSTLARHQWPAALYIGHIKIAPQGALLEHGPGPGRRGDHDAIKVPAGTYVALRQREYDEREHGRLVAD